MTSNMQSNDNNPSKTAKDTKATNKEEKQPELSPDEAMEAEFRSKVKEVQEKIKKLGEQKLKLLRDKLIKDLTMIEEEVVGYDKGKEELSDHIAKLGKVIGQLDQIVKETVGQITEAEEDIVGGSSPTDE